MKVILMVLAFLISCISFGQFSKEELKMIKSQTPGKGIHRSYDQHTGLYKIESDDVEFSSGYFNVYFTLSKKEGKIVKSPMYIKMVYTGTNWIFANKFGFAFVSVQDGDEKLNNSVSIEDDNATRTVLGTNVCETLSGKLTTETETFLKGIINDTRMVSIRIEGDDKYSQSAVFGLTIKKKLQYVFPIYESLKY